MSTIWAQSARGAVPLVKGGATGHAAVHAGHNASLRQAALRELFARGGGAGGLAVPRHFGQLGIAPDETVPEDVEGQARLCFGAIGAILAEAGMGPADVVKVTGYVTDRAHFPGYMGVRDAWLAGTGRRPASTLLVVGGFTRAELLVEVEVLAAAP